MRRHVLAVTLAFLPALAWGQAPPALSGGGASNAGPVVSITGPGGTYTITVKAPAGVAVEQGAGYVILRWDGDPEPGPGPDPDPDPDPPPDPPPPAPEWGPLARVLILYETAAATGKEPFYSQDVIDALTATVPAGEDGRPAWRIWDRNLTADREPAWGDWLAKAKAQHGNSTEARLYAFDKQGRLQSIATPASMTPAELVTTIRKMGGK